jgi:phosphoglycolate phosphatase-like HAD superfamily hydrolase
MSGVVLCDLDGTLVDSAPGCGSLSISTPEGIGITSGLLGFRTPDDQEHYIQAVAKAYTRVQEVTAAPACPGHHDALDEHPRLCWPRLA